MVPPWLHYSVCCPLSWETSVLSLKLALKAVVLNFSGREKRPHRPLN